MAIIQIVQAKKMPINLQFATTIIHTNKIKLTKRFSCKIPYE